jgi:hypothetical protein
MGNEGGYGRIFQTHSDDALPRGFPHFDSDNRMKNWLKTIVGQEALRGLAFGNPSQKRRNRWPASSPDDMRYA